MQGKEPESKAVFLRACQRQLTDLCNFGAFLTLRDANAK